MPHDPHIAEIFEATPLDLAVIGEECNVVRVNAQWRTNLGTDGRPDRLENLFPGASQRDLGILRLQVEAALSGKIQRSAISLSAAREGQGTYPRRVEIYRLEKEENLVLVAMNPALSSHAEKVISSQEIILDSITERLIYCDTNRKILWANRAAREDAGFDSLSDLVGMSCSDIWSDHYGSCDSCPALWALEKGASHSAGYFESQDGRYWSTRAFPVNSQVSEDILGCVIMAREVTEEILGREALRESEQWYRTTLQSITDGVVVADPRERVIIINPAAAEMIGWSQDESRGRTMESIVRLVEADSLVETTGPFAEVLESGKPTESRSDLGIVDKDGHMLNVEIKAIPIPGAQRDIRGVMIVFRDISERRERERQLVERERRFRTLAENAPDAITRFDRRARLIYGNRSLESLVGSPPAMAIERTPREMPVAQELGQAWEDALRDSIYLGQKVTRNVIVGKSGDRRSLVIDVVPEAQGGERPETFLSVIRDVTALDMIARHLADQNRRLSTMTEALARFVDFPHNVIRYDTITRYLLDMTGALGVFFCTLTEDGSHLRLGSMQAQPSLDEILRETPSAFSVGALWPTTTTTLHSIERGQLVTLEGISEMTGDAVPPSKASKIEKRERIGGVYSIGIIGSDRLLGALTILMPKEMPLEDPQLVEAYSHAVAGAMEAKDTEDALRESEEKYRSLAETAGDGIIIVQDEKIAYTNQRFASMVGIPEDDIIGSVFTDYFRPEEVSEIITRHHRRLAGERLDPLSETTLVDVEGRTLPVEVNVQIFTYGGRPAVLSILRDISERKMSEERLRYLNLHDQMTGLYNRAYFEDSLDRLDVPRQLPISIIVGDVNGLKVVNDGFGVDAGDRVLKDIAATMEEACRAEDIVARIGSDEFALLLPGTDERSAQRVVDRMRRDLAESLTEPIPISVSLGWATKVDPADDIHSTMSVAESAMYRDKMLEMSSVRSSIIASLTETLRATSMETEEHAERMERMAVAIGKRLDMDDSGLANLAMVARLHDIGKVGVPSFILRKPGKLTDREWKIVAGHPEIGARIASSLPDLAPIAEDIRSHHERWDGRGYPRGLSGRDIPLRARIVGVVDAFDVMTSGRPYQRAKTEDEALDEVRRCAGSQFDPEIAEILIELAEGDGANY